MGFPDLSFEAIVFDWDGTAVPDRQADASPVRARVEALSRRGVDIVVVSGTHVGNIDGQLTARPSGPGQLFLCLNRGSEVFAVDETGPRLLYRRVATPQEDAALDRAAALTISRLAARGLTAHLVSQRLNRRKIDLIPEPEWADPPKARINELLDAVSKRLRSHGFTSLSDVVQLAMTAAAESGLRDPRVTSDAKHVEIGLTDKSDSVRWVLEDLRKRGVGPGLVLLAGDEFGPMGGVTGSDAWMLVPEAKRATAISVGIEPEGLPAGVRHLAGGPQRFVALLDDQLERRMTRRTPAIDEDPDWTIMIEGDESERRRVNETLLTIADGSFGTRGALEEHGEGSDPLVLAEGIYADGSVQTLLPAPLWTKLSISLSDKSFNRRVLDLRTGVLHREQSNATGALRAIRFSSLAEPGAVGLRAEGPGDCLGAGSAPLPPLGSKTVEAGDVADARWTQVSSSLGGGITAAATSHETTVGNLKAVERLALYRASAHRPPTPDSLLDGLRQVRAVGFDQLLAHHRAAWASRWEDAEVAIDGDPEAQLAARFALFHLMASVRADGEAAVGARGLSGRAYAGHVFWDADVFVLPMLAATHPPVARAMLEYRLRRLPAARSIAGERGLAGARFPWESAHDGSDVTPRHARDRNGNVVQILTGDHEEHIVADVAWAAWHYAQWTGDRAFLDGPGRLLLTETARYWASRVRYDGQGKAHLYGVVGPDEYHGPVDDNAFTNVMARWNLNHAADLVERDGQGGCLGEVARWRATARALVDGYDAATGRYEQFAGFFGLEPLLISDFAEPPVAADLLLSRERVAGAQIVKQADVLMLHHLVPEEVAPGSLAPNLAFYGPRTAHGSSLSPAIHAALLARAGEPDRALDLFRIALRLDLDDLTGTTAGGLHLATMGGIWQALAFGFAGLRVCDGVLSVNPQLPSAWRALELHVRVAGQRIKLRAEHDAVGISPDGPVRICLGDGPVSVVERPTRFARVTDGWKEAPP